MPRTAFNHFRQDIARARAIVVHANLLPADNLAEQRLRSDLLRSAWMFAAGAMDAYFCDAYTDLLARVLMSRERQNDINLPAFISKSEVPLSAVFANYQHRENWRWRMMARRKMARENVLSLDTVKALFNPFCRADHKFFLNLMDTWAVTPNATRRVFGRTAAQYQADMTACAASADQQQAERDARNRRNASVGALNRRFKTIFQRRHDCIHNCDRPLVAPRPLDRAGTVRNVIRDVRFLVTLCNQHIGVEFREFLARIGCTPQTMNQVGY